jgi:hypothetical protein
MPVTITLQAWLIRAPANIVRNGHRLLLPNARSIESRNGASPALRGKPKRAQQEGNSRRLSNVLPRRFPQSRMLCANLMVALVPRRDRSLLPDSCIRRWLAGACNARGSRLASFAGAGHLGTEEGRLSLPHGLKNISQISRKPRRIAKRRAADLVAQSPPQGRQVRQVTGL